MRDDKNSVLEEALVGVLLVNLDYKNINYKQKVRYVSYYGNFLKQVIKI